MTGQLRDRLTALHADRPVQQASGESALEQQHQAAIDWLERCRDFLTEQVFDEPGEAGDIAFVLRARIHELLRRNQDVESALPEVVMALQGLGQLLSQDGGTISTRCSLDNAPEVELSLRARALISRLKHATRPGIEEELGLKACLRRFGSVIAVARGTSVLRDRFGPKFVTELCDLQDRVNRHLRQPDENLQERDWLWQDCRTCVSFLVHPHQFAETAEYDRLALARLTERLDTDRPLTKQTLTSFETLRGLHTLIDDLLIKGARETGEWHPVVDLLEDDKS